MEGLIDTRNEYIEHLQDIIGIAISKRINAIWSECFIANKGVKGFQNELYCVKKWNNNIVNDEYKKIVKNTKCKYLLNLIKIIIITTIKIKIYEYKDQFDNIKIKIPNPEDFVHKCFINVASFSWKNAYLFNKKNIKDAEYQNNLNIIEENIRIIIKKTFRDFIPFDEIFNQIEDNLSEDVKQFNECENKKHSKKISKDKKTKKDKYKNSKDDVVEDDDDDDDEIEVEVEKNYRDEKEEINEDNDDDEQEEDDDNDEDEQEEDDDNDDQDEQEEDDDNDEDVQEEEDDNDEDEDDKEEDDNEDVQKEDANDEDVQKEDVNDDNDDEDVDNDEKEEDDNIDVEYQNISEKKICDKEVIIQGDFKENNNVNDINIETELIQENEKEKNTLYNSNPYIENTVSNEEINKEDKDLFDINHTETKIQEHNEQDMDEKNIYIHDKKLNNKTKDHVQQEKDKYIKELSDVQNKEIPEKKQDDNVKNIHITENTYVRNNKKLSFF